MTVSKTTMTKKNNMKLTFTMMVKQTSKQTTQTHTRTHTRTHTHTTTTTTTTTTTKTTKKQQKTQNGHPVLATDRGLLPNQRLCIKCEIKFSKSHV